MGILFSLFQQRRARLLTNKEQNWLRRRENLRRGKQEGRAQFEWRINPATRQPYDFSQRTPGKTPLFGSSEGFGLDYVQTHSINPPPIGHREDVSKPIVNRSGSTAGLRPARIHERSEIQETTRKFPLEGTDQKPVATRRSSGASWDGIVRNKENRKSYLTKRTRQETVADRIAKELKAEPYSFLT